MDISAMFRSLFRMMVRLAKKTETDAFFARYSASDHHIFDKDVDLRIIIHTSE